MKVFIAISAIAALTVGLLMGMPGIANAHPSSDIPMKFNKKTHMLTANIMHSTRDATQHYIYRVVVSLDGKEIITQSFSSQTDKEKQQVSYTIIDAKAGSKITVKATCNKNGDLEKTLTVK